jgi:uncharacterized protein (TIGR00251 family)
MLGRATMLATMRIIRRGKPIAGTPPAGALPTAALPPCARLTPTGLELRLKVVPGASRSAIVGLLGDRLKVRVAAAPEGGKANRAACALLRDWTHAEAVEIVSGHASAEKTALLHGATSLPALE